MKSNNKVPSCLRPPVTEEKKHYFLASGSVFFFPVGKPEDVGSVQLNGVFTTNNGTVPVSGIAKAQQTLQQQAADRMGKQDIQIQIVDVQLVSISSLGHMLPSEFHDLDAPKPATDVAPAKVQ